MRVRHVRPLSAMSSEIDGWESGHTATQGDAGSATRLFDRELRELRDIGFAEGLPLAEARHAVGDVFRLECGSMGVAVEFSVSEEEPSYRVVSLAPHDRVDPLRTSRRWRDIMMVLHGRMSPDDHD